MSACIRQTAASHPKFSFTPTFIFRSLICPNNCDVVFLWKYVLVFEKWFFSFDRSNMQILKVVQSIHIIGVKMCHVYSKSFPDFPRGFHRRLNVSKVQHNASPVQPACMMGPSSVRFTIWFAYGINWHVVVNHNCHLQKKPKSYHSTNSFLIKTSFPSTSRKNETNTFQKWNKPRRSTHHWHQLSAAPPLTVLKNLSFTLTS